jgi:DNA-binding XRE family transcriptional regulator
VTARDPTRRQRAIELRQQGLTLKEIGRQLSLSLSGVSHLLRPPAHRPYAVRCARCGAVIHPDGKRWDRAGVLCLPCLAQTPDAPLAERLRAYRVAAGLSQAALARRAGVAARVVVYLETGRRTGPRPATLAKLAAVLGPGLVQSPAGEK